jgi:hypothetical protein
MIALRSLFDRWRDTSTSIGRRDYIASAVLLALLKYAGDVAIFWLGSDRLWTPADYIASLTGPGLLSYATGSGAELAMPMATTFALAVWALPFIWMGM